MEKILICDDSKNVRLILSKWLKNLGEVVETENGKMALREYHGAHQKKEPFTLAIIDLSMPEMTGEEAITHIRQVEEACDVFDYLKIIVLTADEDKATAMRLFKLNVDHFIHKPLDKESFRQVLKKLSIYLD
jgi:CheY-like chemotaxis protein